MFEVNGVYANRIGKYTVLELSGPKMRVRYEDGSEVDLRVAVQERIWLNIAAEEEEKEAARRAREQRRRMVSQNTKYFIKAISSPSDDLSFSGWTERVVMVLEGTTNVPENPGDRLIYYAIEMQTFFAVVTITGSGFMANPKKYTYAVNQAEAIFYPIDIDAAASKPSLGVTHDSVELESQPNFRKLHLANESYLQINEDDFELLAEALTEISEEEEEIEEEEEVEIEEDNE